MRTAWALGCWAALTAAAPANEPEDKPPPPDRFAEEIKKARDPVAVAVAEIADVKSGHLFEAMDVLAEHWQDPRSEEALEELAGHGPMIARCVLTPAGEASIRLGKIQTRKEYHELMKGADTPKEQAARVRKVFEDHPRWLDPKKRPSAKTAVVGMLLATLEQQSGPEAVDLAARAGMLGRDWARRYPDVVLATIKKLGRDQTLDTPYLLSAVSDANPKGLVDLAEAWLDGANGEEQVRALISVVRSQSDGQDRLIRRLKDDRPLVVRHAVSWLSYSFPDRTSLFAIDKAMCRRKADGADAQELSYYEAVLRGIREEIAEKERAGKP
jgi:hypothetical protein